MGYAAEPQFQRAIHWLKNRTEAQHKGKPTRSMGASAAKAVKRVALSVQFGWYRGS